MAAAHLIERLTCRLYGMNCRVLNLPQGEVAVAHLIERLACRIYGLKFLGLNLPQGSGKMEEKILRKGQ